jgi:TPR repeat protein
MKNDKIKKLYKLYENAQYRETYKLAKELAQEGSSDAKCVLGDFYSVGTVVKKNIKKAIKLYLEAFEKSNYKAAFSLATIYSSIEPEKRPWHDEKLGDFYYKKVYELCLIASEEKDGEAMYYLGALYNFGFGIKEDLEKSLYWFEKAYEYGYDFALNKLYEFYGTNSSPFYNVQKAREYFRLLEKSGKRVI